MEWLNRAVELNRTGVFLCNSGSEVEALEYFRSALEILSLLAKGCEESTCSSMWPSAPPCSHVLSSFETGIPQTCLSLLSENDFQLKHEDPSPCKQRAIPAASATDGEELLFVYRHALLFETTSWIDPVRLSYYIAVTEFNMALSIHLRSRQLGEKALLNAMHVYDYCLEHINHSGCCADSCQVLFAALNNKAAIFYDFSSFQCSKHVLEALMDAITCCKNTGVLNTINDDDLEGFLFNAMLMKGASLAPAA